MAAIDGDFCRLYIPDIPGAGCFTGRRRWIKTIQVAAFWVLAPGLCIGGENSVAFLRQHYGWPDATYFAARAGFWCGYTLLLAAWLARMYHCAVATCRARLATGSQPASVPCETTARRVMNSAGMHLAMFWWLFYLMWRSGDQLAGGVVAGIVLLAAIRQFVLVKERTGLAFIRMTFGYVAGLSGFILGVINLRLDVWLANDRGVSVGEIHQLYPMWLVPLFTLVVVGWVAGLLWWTGETRNAGKPAVGSGMG